MREAGHTPELNCVERYPQDTDDLVPTDFDSFHVDSATVSTDTFLCCYSKYGAWHRTADEGRTAPLARCSERRSASACAS